MRHITPAPTRTSTPFSQHHSPRAPWPRSRPTAHGRHGLEHSDAPAPLPPIAARPAPTLDKPRHFPLSRTTERVLRLLLEGDLYRLRADGVAESLGMSGTTLRRRLRADHTSYQFLLDRARQYRCERLLAERRLPGKCLAEALGYNEVNSFYRAFRRWAGQGFSEFRQQREC